MLVLTNSGSPKLLVVKLVPTPLHERYDTPNGRRTKGVLWAVLSTAAVDVNVNVVCKAAAIFSRPQWLKTASRWPPISKTFHHLTKGVLAWMCIHTCISTCLISTNWGWDKIATISQMTFSNAFSWMTTYEFHLRFLLKFILKITTNNNPALVQIMAWRRPGDKPLSEPMMVSLLTYICVKPYQWWLWFSDQSGKHIVLSAFIIESTIYRYRRDFWNGIFWSVCIIRAAPIRTAKFHLFCYLNTQSAARFLEISSPFGVTSSGPQKWHSITESGRNLERIDV